MKKLLYLSYDGLLDQLGGSQILPYLVHSTDIFSKIKIISFEKKDKTAEEISILKETLVRKNISWHHFKFSYRLGVLGKIFDLIKFYTGVLVLMLFFRPNIIHSRGHIAAGVGAKLSVFFRKKHIFDFRGLWADEKVDKGGWDLQNHLERIMYLYYKRKERVSLQKSTSIVVLSEKMLEELPRISNTNAKVSVIPCCTDFNLFKILKKRDLVSVYDQLGISQDDFVFGYIGSIGKMYRLDLFFELISAHRNKLSSTKGLIITNDLDLAKVELDKAAIKYPNLENSIRIISSKREKIPDYINILKMSVAFIEPSYARIASSPTKIGESLACGIPVISNYGVGDIANHIKDKNLGIIVDINKNDPVRDCIKSLYNYSFTNREIIRNNASEIYNLEIAVKRYRNIYNSLLD